MGARKTIAKAIGKLRTAAVPSESVVSEPTTVAEVPLSVYVITRKEDFPLLPEMIASLPVGIELVIVDTVNDAAKAGQAPTADRSEVIDGRSVRTYTWYYARWDFASARNAALGLCSREWCMWMDSDDRMPTIYHGELLGVLAGVGAGVGGFVMGCSGFQPPYEEGKRGSYYATPHVRMHRNVEKIAWRGYAHEQIDISIQDAGYSIEETAIVIIHVGYVTDIPALTAKMGRNVYLLCRQIAEDREFIPSYYLHILQNNLTTYNEMKGQQHG